MACGRAKKAGFEFFYSMYLYDEMERATDFWFEPGGSQGVPQQKFTSTSYLPLLISDL
jgi:hypothetical protein